MRNSLSNIEATFYIYYFRSTFLNIYLPIGKADLASMVVEGEGPRRDPALLDVPLLVL